MKISLPVKIILAGDGMRNIVRVIISVGASALQGRYKAPIYQLLIGWFGTDNGTVVAEEKINFGKGFSQSIVALSHSRAAVDFLVKG